MIMSKRYIVARPFKREQQTSKISTENLRYFLQSLEKQAKQPRITGKSKDIFSIPLEQIAKELPEIILQTPEPQSDSNTISFYYLCFKPKNQTIPRQYSFLTTFAKTAEIMRALDRYFESWFIELVSAHQFIFYLHNNRIEQSQIHLQDLKRMPSCTRR